LCSDLFSTVTAEGRVKRGRIYTQVIKRGISTYLYRECSTEQKKTFAKVILAGQFDVTSFQVTPIAERRKLDGIVARVLASSTSRWVSTAPS
jgi:hypothetical protein